MRTAVGATQTLMRRHGDWWVTVVGDVPPATLLMFANGLERKK
jgi:sigma-E factor negative regulatory protein RseB